MKITYIDADGKEQVIDLSDQMVRELQAVADSKNIPFPQAMQQVIASGNFLEAVQDSGGKILVEQNNQLREVVREPQTV